MRHSYQIRPSTEKEHILMVEYIDTEEWMRSSDQEAIIENEPMDDSGSDSDTDVDEMRQRSPLIRIVYKPHGGREGNRLEKASNYNESH